jgi:hypothetical protein
MSTEKRFISLGRIDELHKSIAFLDTYKPVENQKHYVADSSTDIVDWGMTAALRQLGELNKQREALIKKIYNKVHENI